MTGFLLIDKDYNAIPLEGDDVMSIIKELKISPDRIYQHKTKADLMKTITEMVKGEL